MKECDILGGGVKTYSDHSYIFSGGQVDLFINLTIKLLGGDTVNICSARPVTFPAYSGTKLPCLITEENSLKQR